MTKNFTKKLLILLPLVFSVVIVFAQGVTTGSMSGVVTESNGQTTPGASVKAIHQPSGTTYSTQTRADGRFNLPNMRIGGPYTVKVSFVGSQDYVLEGINLNLGQEYTINAKLTTSIGSLGEVVVKSTQNKVINSNRTGARETVTRAQIDALPTIGRSLSDYTKLTPSAKGSSFGGRNQAYNNLTVDGALFNNTFGLEPSLGGQTNSQPISLDAIEQIQVDIAPYDVRQGFFTGAGVNTVTKSGTNEIKGTAYYYYRNPAMVGLEAGPFTNVKQDFSTNNRGFAIGGPIIKNKLFFFINGEQERLLEPATLFTALKKGGVAGGNVSKVQADSLNKLKDFLIKNYDYNPGDFEGYSNRTESDKITVKLDWNINKNNTLSAKYFYLKSFRDRVPSSSGAFYANRTAGPEIMPFSGSQFVQNNNFNIGIIELNTRIGNKFANKLSVGVTALRDFRESRAGKNFPMVDIANGFSTTVGGVKTITAPTGPLTTFGYEPFSANNLLNTDTYTFSDDFTIYTGKHEITVGTSNQLNSFKNGFAPNYYGNFNFKSTEDFYNSANNGLRNASRYELGYSALKDGSFPFAYLKSLQLSLYAQDKFSITNNFKLTYGIRADYSNFPTKLDANTNLEKLYFRDSLQLNVSKFPTSKILMSPRVGFNYDVNGKGETQIRGGAGLFTGQVPFVWLSNQASNNGIQFGSLRVDESVVPGEVQDPKLEFDPSVDAYRPVGASPNTQYNIAVTDRNFKFPQVLRINAAVDQKLPYGILGTLEALYSKDINAVLFQNVNLPSTGTPLTGSDNRIRYTSTRIYGPGANTLANPNIRDAILFKNTNKGYSYFITAQLQKQFDNGFMASFAYTYGKSRSVNDGGSIAQSIWRDRQVSGDPNADELGFSSANQPNRIISYVSYRKEYAKNFATSIGVTFESSPSQAVLFNNSITYRGDVNNDALPNNDLIYVPNDKADILLVKDSPSDPRTPDQIWSQLNAFITQDPYLSKNRGKVVERNGAVLPYVNQFNLNFTQDFFIKVAGKRNTLRFTADVINFGNLLNSNWGLSRLFAVNAQQPLSFKGLAGTASTSPLVLAATDSRIGSPVFSFPYADTANQIPVTSSYRINTESLWRAQFGIRYIFN